MGEPYDPPSPHRRRTPCCSIEAFRYLEEHGFLDAARAGGLDVERLARAIRLLSQADMFNLGEPFEQVAADIAAEYARAASPATQPVAEEGG